MSEILHSGYFHPTLRQWQSCNTELHPHNFMFPLFILGGDESLNDQIEEIASMPGIKRLGVNKVVEYLKPIIENGLKSVLLFGVIRDSELKDPIGSLALTTKNNPVVMATRAIKSSFPEVIVATDICLCPYTDHGHCGILRSDGTIDNSASILKIAEQALFFAQNGADIVAPSDMMDGRIGAIKSELRKHDLDNKVSVLSYAVKFASGFYGPFRDAAKSAPTFGDRKRYQLPLGSRGLAHRAAERDVNEGADMLMVKPGLAYLDLVRETKDRHPDHPLFIYQVSGEYAMIHHGAANGAFDFEKMLQEIFTSMRRAGADVIISYYTPNILKMLRTQAE